MDEFLPLAFEKYKQFLYLPEMRYSSILLSIRFTYLLNPAQGDVGGRSQQTQ